MGSGEVGRRTPWQSVQRVRRRLRRSTCSLRRRSGGTALRRNPLSGVYAVSTGRPTSDNCPSDFAKTPSLWTGPPCTSFGWGGEADRACFTVKVVLQAAFWDGGECSRGWIPVTAWCHESLAAYPNA